MAGLIVLGVVVLLVLWFVLGYNTLIRLRNQVKNAWSQIDVQLKRRHDLIPNLIETAKGYVKHERETLESVTKARTAAVAASGRGAGEQAKAEGALTAALSQFLVVVERYPDLKANQNFLALQEELSSTENKIGFSRQFYNDIVLSYNNAIAVIPRNIIAGLCGFTAAEFFQLESPAERQVPKVSF
ncbi:MAG: LemA family protein [Planctomycetes bacterium]|nr:LemA family protein [Planctomycetota bacterium]MBM4079942.1 LemA family protein [Planctomycetota bacterium]MBM4083500.1 LemA family protein [Planctomycetota bacterium]